MSQDKDCSFFFVLPKGGYRTQLIDKMYMQESSTTWEIKVVWLAKYKLFIVVLATVLVTTITILYDLTSYSLIINVIWLNSSRYNIGV